MRGRGRGRRFDGFRGGNSPLESRILALNPYSFIESDYYSVSAGNVTAFLEKVPDGTGIRAITSAHALVQATAAYQVAEPTANASYNNRKVAEFGAAAATTFYRSNSTAAAWKFHHDGTGGTGYYVADTSVAAGGGQYLYSTTITAQAGVRGGGTGVWFCPLYASGVAISILVSGPIFTANQPFICSHSYEEGRLPKEYVVEAVSTQLSGDTSAPPSSAADGVLDIGGLGPSDPWVGNWAMSLHFDRIVDAATDAIVRAYILAKWGVS